MLTLTCVWGTRIRGTAIPVVTVNDCFRVNLALERHAELFAVERAVTEVAIFEYCAVAVFCAVAAQICSFAQTAGTGVETCAGVSIAAWTRVVRVDACPIDAAIGGADVAVAAICV